MSSSSSSSDSEPAQAASPARSPAPSSNNSDSDASSNRRNARRAVVKPPIDEGGDSSDTEDSSDEETRHLSRKKPAPKKRRRQSSEDDPFEQYRHLFDTREEYDECMGKSEKEREQIIYERMTTAEDKKTRREIEERLAARQAELDGSGSGSSSKKDKKKEKKRRVSSDTDSDEERKPSRRSSESEMDAEFHHPSEVDKKKKQKQAMADLAAKRKDKEKKEAASKKAALNIDDIFGKGDSDDDSSSSSSNSTRSSSSSSSSRDSSPDRRSSSSQRHYVDNRSVESKEDLIRVRLSRHFLSTIIHTPFFKDVVVGGYVLLRAGHSASSKHDFQILKIIDVVETPKTYNLENTKTNKGIKTRWGKQEKTYTLQYISNSPWLEDYFSEWKSVTSQEDTLPTMEYVKKKEAEIKKYRNHNWTTKDIDYMVEQKKKHNSSHTNFALKKADLMRRKDAAIQEGNAIEVERLLHEIDAVDSRADALDKKRSADISAVTWINERNRHMQREKFFGNSKMDKAFSITDNDDPFTRKKEKMRVVCGTRNNGDPTAAPEEKPKVEEKPKAVLPLPTLTPSASSSSLSSLQTGSSKEKKSFFDLQKLVNFEEIDFSALPKTLPSASASSSDYNRRSHHNGHDSRDPPPKKSRTSMSLDEYRAMKAKQNASTSFS